MCNFHYEIRQQKHKRYNNSPVRGAPASLVHIYEINKTYFLIKISDQLGKNARVHLPVHETNYFRSFCLIKKQSKCSFFYSSTKGRNMRSIQT